LEPLGKPRKEGPLLQVRQAVQVEAHRLGEAGEALHLLREEGLWALQVQHHHHLAPFPKGQGQLGQGGDGGVRDVARLPPHIGDVEGLALPEGPAHHAAIRDPGLARGRVGGEKAKPPFGGEHPDLHVPPSPRARRRSGRLLRRASRFGAWGRASRASAIRRWFLARALARRWARRRLSPTWWASRAERRRRARAIGLNPGKRRRTRVEKRAARSPQERP
jgi:hypothetical protein